MVRALLMTGVTVDGVRLSAVNEEALAELRAAMRLAAHVHPVGYARLTRQVSHVMAAPRRHWVYPGLRTVTVVVGDRGAAAVAVELVRSAVLVGVGARFRLPSRLQYRAYWLACRAEAAFLERRLVA
jgi:hypothetical protein